MLSLEESLEYVLGWLREVLMRTGKFSALLVEELATHNINRTVHIHSVFDQIGRLEDPSFRRGGGVKPASPFTGKLKGFWHQHYSEPGHLIKNLQNDLHSPEAWVIFEKMADAINQGDDPSLLVPELVIGGYERRHAAGKMTGEWIVFAKHNDINYYLTLGNHTEGDAELFGRIMVCIGEFPELSALLPPD
jgi:hypothetical protein